MGMLGFLLFLTNIAANSSCIFHHSFNHNDLISVACTSYKTLSQFHSPERDATDVVKLQLSFQHLLYLPFLGSLLHLLSTNQIDTLRGQDQVSLDGLVMRGKRK